ncbi:MAG: pyridoxamine 5'-phosphate oxidase family protein [Oscillospiraceae bacterium]|nr:pyridoxamine 5'-phosphate oxidase family protein [Oscillospiraceae bacterium]
MAEPEENAHLLDTSAVGTLATLDADGSPYAVPVHFAALDGKVYIHGGAHGRKYENLLRRNRVCFTAWDLRGYTRADNPEPCRTGTSYRSVVLNGTAALVEDAALKRRVLRALAVKYSPEKDADNMPDAAVARTCVVELHGELTEKTRG